MKKKKKEDKCRGETERREGGHVTTEADLRVTQPHVTEAERSLEAKRGEECIHSLLRAFRGSAALPTL